MQGLASQFAALCVDARPGQQVLDLCAAPGGRSLTLAECMQDNGRLVSGEFAPSRVPLLQRPLTAAASPVPWLLRTMPPSTITLGRNSTVCSAMCPVPAWALSPKKPDIRYKDLDGIENLLDTQQKILQNGADSLAENGRLVYSTCTVNVQENQNQVEKIPFCQS